MLRRLLPLFLACLAGLPAPAAGDAQPAAGPELPALIDELVVTQLFLHDVPGAAVALVGDGRVLHLGGYGYADRAAGTPVQAGRTLFGTGSVSKLFTWTAVMQLVEQGVLELDRDVNTYLRDLPLPATWPQPVTLAHLLTHTAGFEERAFGFYARRPADLVPLQTFLAAHRPARVYPPGKVSAYSNYGAALAGHIVARAAGLPFEEVIEQRILAPLGMRHSSFRQPLPPALAPDLATGYRGTERSGHGWYQARPSAALRTTAADMARFLLAHLQQGRPGARRILQPASLAAMQQRQFGNHPAVSGLTYGFQELRRGGQRILWHPGDTLYFTAAVYLLPEHGLGLFVVHNQAGVRALQQELLDALLARLPPAKPRPVPAAGGGVAPPARPAGTYLSSRRGVTGLERLVAPFRAVRVRAAEPGVLHITGLAMTEETRWTGQASGIYRDRAGAEYVVFHTDADGSTWLFEGNAPAFGYIRLPWYASPAVQAALLGACALVFLVAVIAGSLRALRRRPPAPAAAWPVRLARPVAGVLGAVNLVFLAGLALLLGQGQQLLYGIPPWAGAILGLPLVSAALSVPVVLLAALAWRAGDGPCPDRRQVTLLAAAAVVFLGLLRYWRLL